jgi:hypothetical protein
MAIPFAAAALSAARIAGTKLLKKGVKELAKRGITKASTKKAATKAYDKGSKLYKTGQKKIKTSSQAAVKSLGKTVDKQSVYLTKKGQPAKRITKAMRKAGPDKRTPLGKVAYGARGLVEKVGVKNYKTVSHVGLYSLYGGVSGLNKGRKQKAKNKALRKKYGK